MATELLEEGRLDERFTVLLPRAYAAVLLALAGAEAEGLDPADPEVWNRVMEASRG